MSDHKQLKITLVKSTIARKQKHIQITKQLGLRKVNHSVLQPDNPAIRGMVNMIDYLVRVDEVTSE
ncbi:MAG: 50S ribosomal protein L30 [Legionella sp.]|nr:50S ribosomal protein L30 [Legionella sp.]